MLFHHHTPPDPPGVQDRRRVPEGEEKDETMREEVSTDADAKSASHNESARDANLAYPVSLADDLRYDFFAPRPYR